MTNYFDGKAIREEILAGLKAKIDRMKRKPTLCVFWIGENEVSSKYVDIKAKVASRLGVISKVFKYNSNVSQEGLIDQIKHCNNDEGVDGIMVQMPLPEKFDKGAVIQAINPEKDVDGLRYCAESDSKCKPPVILAIFEAIKRSGKKLDNSNVVIIGKGFLVGHPLARSLEMNSEKFSIADSSTENLSEMTKGADILISATGVGGIIKPEMVKEGAVLIDAGTTEIGGKLAGDIDSECYKKSSYYTPVPGGIGPVTVAMLMKNLVNKAD